MLAFTANELFTPTEIVEHPLLLVDEGTIVEIASRSERTVPAGVRTVDLADNVIAPGYIDLHIHGGAGFDFMDDDKLLDGNSFYF